MHITLIRLENEVAMKSVNFISAIFKIKEIQSQLSSLRSDSHPRKKLLYLLQQKPLNCFNNKLLLLKSVLKTFKFL